MNEQPATRTDNPFSASKIRPGALAYLYPAASSPEALIRALQAHGWWGQIIGPHGTGKSSLLASLRGPLMAAGRHVMLIELRDQQRSLPVRLSQLASLAEPPMGAATGLPALQVIVDGYEQLSRWNRCCLRLWCRLAGCGLLITSHTDTGLPTLLSTSVSADTARRLLRSLLGSDTTISDSELLLALEQQQGNLRETWFQLYDLYEQKRYNR